MKWINLSDRNPDGVENLIIRIKSTKKLIKYYDIFYNSIDFDDIEWLDETEDEDIN